MIVFETARDRAMAAFAPPAIVQTSTNQAVR
jgi:hypothetical protein